MKDIEGTTTCIPPFDDHANVEIIKPCFNSTVQGSIHQDTRYNDIACHNIATNGPLVRIKPQGITSHCRAEIENHIR